MNLRPYQVKAKIQIRESFSNGAQAVVLCMPTGSGKTVSFADIALDSIGNGYRVMILCNRKELIAQANKKLKPLGISATLINPNYRTHKDSMCYIASIDTLRNRQLPNVSLLIVDEAHIRTFDNIVLEYKSRGTLIIGATATPSRKGRKFLQEDSRLASIYPEYTGQMGNVYDDMVMPTTISELLGDDTGEFKHEQYLLPPIYYIPEDEIDLSDVKHKGDDYDKKALFEKYNKPKMYDGVIDNYIKHANGTKAICFCIDVDHSIKTAEEFNKRGISAEHVDGNTPDGQRFDIFERFRVGTTMILCNYGVATTGYDEPSVQTIILNSATESLPLYLQKVGRGARLCPEINKTHFIVIDHGTHLRRLGWWQEDRKWSLDTKFVSKTSGVGPVRKCEACEAMLPLSVALCPYCNVAQEKQPTELKLHQAEFVLMERNEMPPELKKPTNKMTVIELEKYRTIKQFSVAWLVRILIERGREALLEYAEMKGYAKGWAYKQEEVATDARKKSITPIWKFIKENRHVTAEFISDFAQKKLKSTHTPEQVQVLLPMIMDVYNNPDDYENVA